MKKAILNKSEDGQYYWNYQQANGKIISTTETFEKDSSALDNLRSHLHFFESFPSLNEFIRRHVVNKTGEKIRWIPEL